MSTDAADAQTDLKQKKRVNIANTTLPIASPRSLVSVVADADEETSQSMSLYTDDHSEKQSKSESLSSEAFKAVSLEEDVPQRLQLKPQIESKLKSHIPPDYQLKFTPNNNDSWWEAAALGLNQLIGNDKVFSVESLRLLVSDIVKTKRPDWLTPELLQEYDQVEDFYLARISETVAQMKEHNRRKTLEGEAIPGSDIEARVLCTQFPINIHWITIDEQGEITEKLTTAEGTVEIECLDKNNYDNNINMIHLVVANDHIVPLINPKKAPSSDPLLLNAIQDVGGATKQKLDRSKRLSGQYGQSLAIKCLDELIATEKTYYQRLRYFAKPQIPGKRAKIKKTIGQWILSCFSSGDDSDNYNVLHTDWPIIKQLAVDQQLNEAVSNIDDFVSYFINPEFEYKEIVFSIDTITKVKDSWNHIKVYLTTHSLMAVEKLKGMDEFIQTATTDNLPGGWVRIQRILEENRLYSTNIIEKFEPFIGKYKGLAQGTHALALIDVLKNFNKGKYRHLEQEGLTDNNLTQWVEIIHSCIVGDEIDGTLKDNDKITPERKVLARGNIFDSIFKRMVAIKEYFYQQFDLQTVLLDNLTKVKDKISVEDDEFFKKAFHRADITFYLQGCLISVVQRIGRYEGLIQQIQKALPNDHPAQPKLMEIYIKLRQLNLMAEDLPKSLSEEQKIDAENYRLDKPYSGYGLANNYAAISYMAKLNSLINCWHYNKLGRDVLLPQMEKLGDEFKKAELEHNSAREAWFRIKDGVKVEDALRIPARDRFNTAKRNYDEVSKRYFAFKRNRALISERKHIEEQYVNEFQNFLQQLFIDSKQYYNDPITSRIDSKIDDIVRKIGHADSIFANSLTNLKRQFRAKLEAEGIKTPSFSLELFDNCYSGNIQVLLNPSPSETRTRSRNLSSATHGDRAPALENKQSESARINSQSTEAEKTNAKLAQHYMRLTIIDRVKTFFQKFDQQTQDAFFKSASDSIQRVSYRIQQSLDELGKLTVKQFEDEYKLRPDREMIGEIIIKIIKPHLAVAGLLKDSYLTGSFGQMLDETTNYLNIINQTNKTPREMFIHNHLPIRDSNNAPPTTDSRPAHKKLIAFYANMKIIADYYCRNGLGLLIAQRAEGVINTQFRHLDIIKKLALLAERMALDPRSEAFANEANEEHAKELLKEMLRKLKIEIIDSYPDHDSRSYNELIHLYNYFTPETGLAELKLRDARRFKNFKLIVNYQISTQDAQHYINKHIAEKYARAVLDYSRKIDSRFFIETAVCKEEAHNEILKIINGIYEMSAVACKIEIDKLFDKLPKGQKNISYLIQYRIHEYVKKALSSKLIYQQGQFGKMIQRINAIHEELNPGAALPYISATGSLLNLADEHQPMTAIVAPPVQRRLMSSMTEHTFITAKSPAKTPAKTPVRRNTALSQYNASHINRVNELPAKKAFILLVAQLLALSHYYRNTEIGEEICSKLQIPANQNLQGHNEIAKELANFALELFLEDEADNQLVSEQNSRNFDRNLRQRDLRAQERMKRLVDKMTADINKIRGDGSLIDKITHSPDSRFAKALEELLPPDKQKATKRNILNPLHFTTAKNKGYLSSITTSKKFIHQVVIEQSYRQFEKLEENLMGSLKKKAGDPQQVAANQIHQELKKLAALPLSSCESEITKLGQGKNIRDLVFSKVSDAIVRSGKIADCIFDGPLGGKLLKVANLLFNTQHTDTRGSFLKKIFTPNQVRRYQNVTQERPSIERTKLHVCGRLLMLSDYYRDTPLGRQVADKGAGEGTASYNVSKKGWADDAENIRKIATGLFFDKDTDEVDAVRNVLNHIVVIIYQIRSAGSIGLHSRFVNELIRIVKDYGNEHDLAVATPEEIDERYLFNNAAQMFDSRIGTDNFEDYIHMSIMQNAAASELVKLKNEINSQRWTCVADKESLEIAEKNLDDLFKKGLKERRALIKALPHGQQDICYLIREKLQNRIPYPFWSMNPQGGQIQKAIQTIKQNLNDIKKPQTSSIVSSARVQSMVGSKRIPMRTQ